MDKEILTVVILAGSAIVAAGIVVIYAKIVKARNTTITQLKMFILGTNVAKIGWAKIEPNPAIKDILFSTMSLLRELNFSQELESVLESFAEKKESIKELQESLPRLKEQIGRHVASQFGRNNVSYYNIGFNMINVTPILELASMNIGDAGKVAAQSIHGIVGDARAIGLPTRNLKAIRKLVDNGLSLQKGEVFEEARSGLIKVSQNYIDILEGK